MKLAVWLMHGEPHFTGPSRQKLRCFSRPVYWDDSGKKPKNAICLAIGDGFLPVTLPNARLALRPAAH